MAENKSTEWVQFVCFKSTIVICEELFQETWIPLGKAFRARGIRVMVLSEKTNVKGDASDFVFICKIWWHSKEAIEGAFPDGLESAGQGNSTIAPIETTQVGCFQVDSLKVVDKDVNLNRHETLVQNEIKVYVMFTLPLSREEVISRAETLCLVKGFQSYCIYEREKELSENASEFYLWIIEAFFQKYFEDEVLQDILYTDQFKDCELAVHQDVVQFVL